MPFLGCSSWNCATENEHSIFFERDGTFNFLLFLALNIGAPAGGYSITFWKVNIEKVNFLIAITDAVKSLYCYKINDIWSGARETPSRCSLFIFIGMNFNCGWGREKSGMFAPKEFAQLLKRCFAELCSMLFVTKKKVKEESFVGCDKKARIIQLHYFISSSPSSFGHNTRQSSAKRF